MGNNSAAIRATQLLAHFPVPHIIMCGIAGGIPHVQKVSEHVRLGDIVVSNIKGVIQYDFKKRFRKRKAVQAWEEIRASPHRPSSRLLEGVATLETEMHLGKYPWELLIENGLTSIGWTRPSEETDQLYDTANPNLQLPHPHDQNRRYNQPQVFLGTIASSNTLLKDPVLRDMLRDKFSAKAVEMEGSGIQDATWTAEVGYLVVRGICDYCDSKKGDNWQKYAAIAAAAYVRALLDSLPENGYGTSIQPIQSPVCELPPPPRIFTGRVNEYKQVVDFLSPSSSRKRRPVGICGMGGVGKSALAYSACWELKEAYPDGQLYVDLQGLAPKPLSVKNAMRQIIRSIDRSGQLIPIDKNEILKRYRDVLSRKRVLILLDNASKESQIRQLIDVAPMVGFVITSRNIMTLNSLEWIKLMPLPATDAFRLLRGVIGSRPTDVELELIAHRCGMLPLALLIAGNFIRLHDHVPVSSYVNDLEDEVRRSISLRGNSPEESVDAVIGLSARVLVRENLQLASRWQLLSVFPSDFDEVAASIVWGIAEEDQDNQLAMDDLTKLIDQSLIQYDSNTQRFNLHDLVKPIARDVFKYGGNDTMILSAKSDLLEAESRFLDYYEIALTLYDPIMLNKLLISFEDTVRKVQPDIDIYETVSLSSNTDEVEFNELRELAILMKDMPYTIRYLERRPDSESKQRTETNIAIQFLRFFARFVEFTERKIASENLSTYPEVLKKWEEIQKQSFYGNLLYYVGVIHALLKQWKIACSFGERASVVDPIFWTAE